MKACLKLEPQEASWKTAKPHKDFHFLKNVLSTPLHFREILCILLHHISLTVVFIDRYFTGKDMKYKTYN